jgi:hypothetical protein
MVQEFFKAPYGGVERLFFLSEDGYVNLMEEAREGDEVQGPDATRGFAWQPIRQRWLTRAYRSDNGTFQRAVNVLVSLATWNPSYQVKLIFDGVNEEQQFNADGTARFTKDRTKYDRPFDAEPYDITNVNDDHGTPYRQDYSVMLPVYAGRGLGLELAQESTEIFAASPQQGRTVQVEITNYQGRMQLKAVQLSAERKRTQRAKV